MGALIGYVCSPVLESTKGAGLDGGGVQDDRRFTSPASTDAAPEVALKRLGLQILREVIETAPLPSGGGGDDESVASWEADAGTGDRRVDRRGRSRGEPSMEEDDVLRERVRGSHDFPPATPRSVPWSWPVFPPATIRAGPWRATLVPSSEQRVACFQSCASPGPWELRGRVPEHARPLALVCLTVWCAPLHLYGSTSRVDRRSSRVHFRARTPGGGACPPDRVPPLGLTFHGPNGSTRVLSYVGVVFIPPFLYIFHHDYF